MITCWQDTYYSPILPPEIKSRAWISMASFVHMYGPSCALQFDSNDFTRRASELSDLPPPLRANFFYSSALPIDDPLSPVPPPSSSSRTGPSRVPPRPFSIFDNTALEEAWQTIHNPKRHQTAPFELEQTSEESRKYQATTRAVSNSISTNRFRLSVFCPSRLHLCPFTTDIWFTLSVKILFEVTLYSFHCMMWCNLMIMHVLKV